LSSRCSSVLPILLKHEGQPCRVHDLLEIMQIDNADNANVT
jgi:hypothetical protein